MPMERVDHHDATRTGVSSTAVAVAYARAVESAKAFPLSHDPFASLFCPPSAIEAKGGFLLDGKQTTVEMRRFLVDMLAVRTRFIDDEVIEGYCARGLRQLVILGAGLDCRAYRLAAMPELHTYEVDFPSVLRHKASVLGGVQPLMPRHPVPAVFDGTDTWARSLQAAGYDPSTPSLWILEGLTGYLLKDELEATLTQIALLTAPKSRMVSTFLGRNSPPSTQMHRFFTNDPARLLAHYGWVSTARQMADVAREHHRTVRSGDYYFVTSDRVSCAKL
eukprot:m.232777 g.232777  ORF g.232777 m.232777 type:complete len:277 (-) comp15723_c0_seq2:90-920(-)